MSAAIVGHETVQTSFSKATKALGALMEDELVLNFCDDADSKSVMELEKLRQKYGRVFLICDNASAHKSKKIQEYIGKIRGEVSCGIHFHTRHSTIQSRWYGASSSAPLQKDTLTSLKRCTKP